MPNVTAQGKTFVCPAGANLRSVLLQNGVALHNGQSRVINCRGLGTCGTCAVEVEGAVSEANWRDQARRSLPPHSPERNLRLACQTQVLDSVRVTKYDGFWGQGAAPMWTPEASSI
ncbi:MAG TPA: 2Fe-2S iron-sulfur cluster-binding protein [Trichocoleus sp.]